MLAITPVRTTRINAVLKELSMRDAIYLCKLPSQQHERGTSELLDRIVESVANPLPGQVVSPRLWTVQERAFVAAHYMAQVLEDGPDFSIGRNGRYSHYLPGLQDTCAQRIIVGEAGGETWLMRPLLGGFSESIERIICSGELPDDRQGWLVGAMAAQLYTEDSEPFDLSQALDADVDTYVSGSAIRLLDLPESDFLELLSLYLVGQDTLEHIYHMQIGDDGIAFLPATTEVPDLPPARFSFSGAFRRETEITFGEPDRGGSGADAVLWTEQGGRDGDDAIGRERDLREQGVRELEESA